VSEVAELSQATVLTTDERFPDRPDRRARWAYLAERARVCRTWGDCFGYLLVATGRAEVMVDDRMHPWDAAPLLPIITEAGGAFTDWRGQRSAFGGDTIATNAALAALVRGILLEEPRV
jgi:fructose-1,6-bisphosphatase/inositol monophosphatase family enzyme